MQPAGPRKSPGARVGGEEKEGVAGGGGEEEKFTSVSASEGGAGRSRCVRVPLEATPVRTLVAIISASTRDLASLGSAVESRAEGGSMKVEEE